MMRKKKEALTSKEVVEHPAATERDAPVWIDVERVCQLCEGGCELLERTVERRLHRPDRRVRRTGRARCGVLLVAVDGVVLDVTWIDIVDVDRMRFG